MKCLVVGRTVEDYAECLSLGLSTHSPAPTTFLYDWRDFDGKLIFTQTPKKQGEIACTIELTKRTISAINEGKKIVVYGNPDWIKKEAGEVYEIVASSGIYDFPVPGGDTGAFALWYAIEKGYNPIYTVGLDWTVAREHGVSNTDLVNMRDYVIAYENGERRMGWKIDGDARNRTVQEIKRLLQHTEERGIEIYKVSDISLLPVPVKRPE